MEQLYYQNSPIYYLIIIVFSCILVLVAIPSIIHVANTRHLFDGIEVGRKKSHKHGISRLGGVAIFCSFIISALLFSNSEVYLELKYLIISSTILFAVGLKDDLAGVNPNTKFSIQFIVSVIMVLFGNVRLTSFYGVFNMFEVLPFWASVTLSILVILLLVNAFNLIDGIDGLAGITGVTVNAFLGVFFFLMGHYELACLAFSLVGATIGFLKFNISPAKIFMGDTGSLLLGLISVVLSIKFIELNKFTKLNSDPFIYSAPSVAVAILIIPIFDSIRVFVLRIIKRGSPFAADHNHIHHRLLRVGLTHIQATAILGCFNLAIIGLTILCNSWGNFILISLIFIICILFNLVLTFVVRSKERASYSFSNIIK